MMVKSFSNQIIEKVEQYIIEQNMLKKGDKILIGLSGGVDSMCLLHIFSMLANKNQYTLCAVHINHALRGVEATKDATFVEKICQKYLIEQVTFFYDVKKMALEQKISEEMAGRIVRYEAFEKARIKFNADKVALAHHRDDVAETFLFNISRGSNIKGALSIPPIRDKIIRPLLNISKNELIKFATENNINFVEDATNYACGYTRNKIRNIVIPCICDNINKLALKHIGEVSLSLRNIYELAKPMIDMIKMDVLESYTHHFLKINIEKAKKYPFNKLSYALYALMDECDFNQKDISDIHYRSIYNLMYKSTGKKLFLPNSIIIYVEYDFLIMKIDDKKNVQSNYRDRITRLNIDLNDIKINQPIFYNIEKYNIRIDLLDNINDMKKYLKENENLGGELFDLDDLSKDIPLSIKYREDDDYMQINKNGNKKKLSRVFIDEKISNELRKKVILIAQEHNILWAVDVKRANIAMIKSNSKKAINIHMNKL